MTQIQVSNMTEPVLMLDGMRFGQFGRLVMKSISQLKKKLWTLTSQYVRRRDSDENGYSSCVTCGLTKHWKEMQAGHWVPAAQGNSTRWDLRNIHVQCYRCNVNLGGNGPEYSAFMEEAHGREAMEELRKLSNETRKITRAEYEEMIEEMTEKLSQLG